MVAFADGQVTSALPTVEDLVTDTDIRVPGIALERDRERLPSPTVVLPLGRASANLLTHVSTLSPVTTRDEPF
jgi:hypothetical protein